MLALFDKLRVEDAEFRDTFREQLRKATNWDLDGSIERDVELQGRRNQIIHQQKQLLNLRLLEEIDADTFAAKAQELRDEEAALRLQIEGTSGNRHEIIDTAIKAFELSQNPRAKWFAADWAAKRRILEIVCLNWKLDGVSLVPEWRKPFDLLAEGLQKKDSRGDTI
jgi:site-specific DNA recombinase